MLVTVPLDDWIGLREISNRKPWRFSHESHGAFRLKISLKPIHADILVYNYDDFLWLSIILYNSYGK